MNAFKKHKQINAAPLSPAPLKTTNSLIEELDISKYLVLKKEGEDGPEVKGGYLDALIVHAGKVQKVNESGEFIYLFTRIRFVDTIENFLYSPVPSDSAKENGKFACSLCSLSSFSVSFFFFFSSFLCLIGNGCCHDIQWNYLDIRSGRKINKIFSIGICSCSATKQLEGKEEIFLNLINSGLW